MPRIVTTTVRDLRAEYHRDPENFMRDAEGIVVDGLRVSREQLIELIQQPEPPPAPAPFVDPWAAWMDTSDDGDVELHVTPDPPKEDTPDG